MKHVPATLQHECCKALRDVGSSIHKEISRRAEPTADKPGYVKQQA
jgi:hypothetical protein